MPTGDFERHDNLVLDKARVRVSRVPTFEEVLWTKVVLRRYSVSWILRSLS